MALTSPDNIYSPNIDDNWAVPQAMGALADSVQKALNKRANLYVGTSQERQNFRPTKSGVHWQDTNGDKKEYIWDGSMWNLGSSHKVLWSHPTGWYLNGTPSNVINLSEPISAQRNGIIMVWSRYENGQPVNGNFNYIYVPKDHVNGVVGSGGFGMNQILADANDLFRKYVYVQDSQIYGLASNGQSPANKQVVRWVIGY